MLQETTLNSINKKAFSHREREDIGVRVVTLLCAPSRKGTPFIFAAAGGGFCLLRQFEREFSRTFQAMCKSLW